MTKINQTAHIEWSKHPELLEKIHIYREVGISFPEIADLFKKEFDLDVHGDTVRSAFKRHREMIRRNLRKEEPVSSKEHAGVVRITKEVIEGYMNLPKGVHIHHIEYDHMRGIAEILLKDETKKYLPETVEAQRPMNVDLSFTN